MGKKKKGGDKEKEEQKKENGKEEEGGGEKNKKKAEDGGNGGGGEDDINNKKDKKGGGGNDGGGSKDGAIVLKVELHCKGCADKIKNAIRGLSGVKEVTCEIADNKVTVRGEKVDPWDLVERIGNRAHKKAEIVSPRNPPRRKDGDADGKKPSEKKKPDQEKKPKELPESTVVLRIRLHCDGCIERVQRTTYKIKGVKQVIVDKASDLVTVKGTMDTKTLHTILKDKLKRGVEVVQEKKDDAGGAKKEKGGGGGEKKEKKREEGETKKVEDKKDKEKVKEEKPQASKDPEAAPAELTSYDFFSESDNRNSVLYDTPQLFSDENPNACSVM